MRPHSRFVLRSFVTSTGASANDAQDGSSGEGLAERAVAVRGVMVHELAEHSLEVTATEDQHPVEALSAEVPLRRWRWRGEPAPACG